VSAFVPSLDEIRGRAKCSLRSAVIAYLEMLGRDIMAGADHWALVDAIEARFRLPGYTLQRVEQWRAERDAVIEAYLAATQTRENRMAVRH